MATRSTNCTIWWDIEDYFVYFSETCVPTAVVDTFNSEKWKLELNFPEIKGSFSIKDGFSLKIAKLNGELDMPICGRVSFLHKWGRVICTGGNERKPQSVSEMMFDFRLPKEFKHIGHMKLKIELEFLVDDLALCTSVRTVFRRETLTFHWCLKDNSKGFSTPKYPLSIQLPESPKFDLCFLDYSNKTSNKGALILGLMRLESDNNIISTNLYNDIVVYYVVEGCINNTNIKSEGFQVFHCASSLYPLNVPPNEFPKQIDLKCQFLFFGGTSESFQTETVFSSIDDNDVTIVKSHAGESLFKNMNFFDVTLKAGSREFKAHRSVLSSVSPVFNAMFENEMSETVTGVVNINDVEPKILKKMLKFIYTGETGDWSFDQNEKLLAAAHMYSISSLRRICSRHLVSMLTEKNVVRVLHLGYLYNDERLKSAAKSLFTTMPSLILESNEWDEYMGECFPRYSDSFITVDKLKKSLQTMKEKSSSLIPPSVSVLFKKPDVKDTEEG